MPKFARMLLITLVLLAGGSAFYSLYGLTTELHKTIRSEQVIDAIEHLKLLLVDAETGQRGFIITNDEGYLDVYKNSSSRIREQFQNLSILLENDKDQNDRLNEVADTLQKKLVEMAKVVEMRKQSFEMASEEVLTHLGKNLMDKFRSEVSNIEQIEIMKLDMANKKFEHLTYMCSIAVAIFVATFLVLIVV